jgi:(R,R)-butanediol dehydrogenase/meso-butanediol dehydrogenase/diacetyl reductase
MKAARFHGRGDVRVEDVTEPHPGPGQVQIAVEWCGICGTDLHEYLSSRAPTPTT